jgi:Tfp pilus assembly protein PilF
LKEFIEALKYNSSNIDCLINIAQIYENRKDLQKSYDYYKKAWGINTSN